LKQDGTVLAWGYNGNGQLGDGTTTNRTEPVSVLDASSTPLNGIIALAVGNNHSLALKSDGTVLVWGYNGYGQLGDGTTTKNSVPQLLQDGNGVPIINIVAIAAGASHSLALKSDGTLLAWGYNGYGQLGDGTTTQRYRVRIVVDESFIPVTGLAAIAADGEHSLALMSDGSVRAWGRNDNGQLGNGTTVNQRHPVRVIDTNYYPLTNVTAIAAGGRHSLALKSDGRVYSWGDNNNGQLGDGGWSDQKRAQWVTDSTGADIDNVTAISAGTDHSLALKADGTLLSWGDNYYEQLGNGTNGDYSTPVIVVDANRQAVTPIGNAGGSDSDGDGVPDSSDAFPLDPNYSADTDADGLADAWETLHFGNLTTANGSSDSDGDGSLDSEEFQHRSDPNVAPGLQSQPIAAGDHHNLGLKLDGTAIAWGRNSYGQLGNGSTQQQPHPVAITVGGVAVTNLQAVASNGSYSLALKQDGTVLAWGYNGNGQLGDGTTTNRNEPVSVLDASSTPLNNIIALAVGGNHSLALKSDGTVIAWGYNGNGQLGDGTNIQRVNPQLLRDNNGVAITGIVAIAAADRHSLALKSDGTLLAWGYNGYGQLGDGTTTQRNRVRIVVDENFIPVTGLTAIAADGDHSLALMSDGSVRAWGRNDNGQLSNGTTANRWHPARVIDSNYYPLTNITAIAAGGLHSLALKSDGRVYSWGDNDNGQLGDGAWLDQRLAHRVTDTTGADISQITAIAAGADHSLALKTDGTLLSWGDNYYEQLGDGTAGDHNEAVMVVNANRQAVAPIGNAGGSDSDGDGVPDSSDAFPLDPNYSADTDADGLADAWETLHFGNLTTANGSSDSDGDGSLDSEEFQHRSDPNVAPELQSQPIAAGDYHSLGLKPNGTAVAWGRNYYGQLGDGSTQQRSHPVATTVGGVAVTNLQALVSNGSHSLALKQDGTVLAWGYNGNGQLGDGTTTNRTEPVSVLDASSTPLNSIIALAVGDNHSLALRSDGTVMVWGYNGNGQLGDGTNIKRLIPQLLQDSNGMAITEIVAIAAGANHSLALKSDGTLLAWGYNGYGQLGDGTTTQRYRVRIVVDENFIPVTGLAAIASDGEHSLALMSDGSVRAWGRNDNGQLGNGDTTNRIHPTPVIDSNYYPLTNITTIAAGGLHSLALKSNGRLYSWGDNDNGQLGDGAWSDQRRAQRVTDSTGADIDNVTAIAAGTDHSLALKTDGTLLSWGDNYYWQLGDGSNNDQLNPVLVTGIDGHATILIAPDNDGDGIPDVNDPDDDNDGLPDTYEDQRAFLDPFNAADAALDQDGDGLTNLQEYQAGSDPAKKDTDRDGLSDKYELDNQLDPTDGICPSWVCGGLGSWRHVIRMQNKN